MQDSENKKDLLLARVPKTEIMNRSAYEFFAGLDEVGRPFWESDMKSRRPVFSDANGIGWGIRAVYNPGLHRYLLSMFHALGDGDGDGSWGLFDAPEPWGPWTTVAYYTNWIDPVPKFGFTFPAKWMSVDGTQMYLVFSGIGVYDSINVIKATLSVRR